MTCGAARQKCSLPSYTKCSYVLSRMSQQPAAAHSSLARSTCCLLSSTPARGSPHLVAENFTCWCEMHKMASPVSS
jgi:hypothetical protein